MNTIDLRQFRIASFAEKSVEEIRQLRKEAGWLIAEGFALCLLGLIATAYAVSTTFVSMYFLGALLLVGAVAQIALAFSSRKGHGFWGPLLAGIFYGISGFLIARNPALSAASLTFLLAPLFMVVGVQRAVASIAIRYPQWGWSFASGVITFLAGVGIWNQWPASGLWLVGTIVGIEMMFVGAATIALAVGIRSVTVRAEHPTRMAA